MIFEITGKGALAVLIVTFVGATAGTASGQAIANRMIQRVVVNVPNEVRSDSDGKWVLEWNAQGDLFVGGEFIPITPEQHRRIRAYMQPKFCAWERFRNEATP